MTETNKIRPDLRARLRPGVHAVRPDEGDRLVEVWEASVRATHRFLSESQIEELRPMVLQALLALPHLLCVRELGGNLVGFVGVVGNKMEALFVHPSWRGAGVGRRLADYAMTELGATSVDVNEQNEQAVAFYERLGFRIEGRSPMDSVGRPLPLLHMRKLDSAAK